MLARCSICLRCFGSLVGDRLEFLAGPSSHSGDVRNCPGRSRTEHRSDDGLRIISFGDAQKVTIARGEVEIDQLCTDAFE